MWQTGFFQNYSSWQDCIFLAVIQNYDRTNHGCGHRHRQSFEVRGANVKSVSTYPLSKTENSSDLVHYFFNRGPEYTLKSKIKKYHALEGQCQDWKTPKDFFSFTELYSFTESLPTTITPSTTSTTPSFFVIIRPEKVHHSISACKTWEQILLTYPHSFWHENLLRSASISQGVRSEVTGGVAPLAPSPVGDTTDCGNYWEVDKILYPYISIHG